MDCWGFFAWFVGAFVEMPEYAQKNKALNRSQLTYMFNRYHVTPQFNITSTSVRGHPYVTNPGLLPTNVERVIFCLRGLTLCYLFQLQNKQREHLLTGGGKKQQFPRQRRHYPTLCRCFNNALKPG